MDNNYNNRFFIGTIIILIILSGITGYYALKLKEKYNNQIQNNYTESFSNLVNYVNNVENYLAKALISKSPENSAKTLTQIWKDSNLALVYLSRISAQNEELSQTAKFLNQISDYSYSLSRKNIEGQALSEDDMKNLEKIYYHSINLEETLNRLSDELYSGELSWNKLNSDINSTKFAQSVDSINVFSNIDSNLNEYEGLIYDGAYSDHINKAEKMGLTGDDIDEENAKNIVKNFFGEDKIINIETNGFLSDADIPSFDFSVSLKDIPQKYSITISKKGGHVVQTSLDREINEEKISNQEANEIGKSYLDSKGFKNMKETYFVKQENVITVNYAYNDNGIIVYPDLIKVKIALDNGDILGIETMGYLNSHTNRKFEEPNISLEDARSKINDNLEIISESRAIIPTEWKTEIDCYEFKGKVRDREFLVYINVQTGKEEDILVILDTPGGTLTV